MEYQSDQALEELRAFVAVVDAQGFSAAARATRGRKATLSQRVHDLEKRLGVPLLVRTTRSMHLTDEGRAYFEHATRALTAARDAEAVVVAAKAHPRGVLRIMVATSLASFVLDHVVGKYLASYPHVRVNLHAAERRLDLVREGFDLAVWAGALDDSSLVARKVGLATAGYFASPRYLRDHAAPRSPDDLASHNLVTFPKANGLGATEWLFMLDGKPRRFPIRPRLVVNDVGLAVRAGVDGLGIVPAAMAIAAPYVAKKQLVAVLRKWTPPGADVYAVFPPSGALVPKTRAFIDLLRQSF